jgi:hypothetical protein
MTCRPPSPHLGSTQPQPPHSGPFRAGEVTDTVAGSDLTGITKSVGLGANAGDRIGLQSRSGGSRPERRPTPSCAGGLDRPVHSVSSKTGRFECFGMKLVQFDVVERAPPLVCDRHVVILVRFTGLFRPVPRSTKSPLSGGHGAPGHPAGPISK